jgi:C4-dicarboxylate-specific signal transduction histidine kinase
VLSGTNQAIARTKDRDTLFKDFCLNAVGDGSFLLAWIGMVDEASGALRIVAADGEVSFLSEIELNANEEPAICSMAEISLHDTCYICNDFLNSPITRPWHQKGRAHGIRSSASLALKQEGRVIGALTLYAGKKDFFDRQQIDLLQQVGADISFALDNMLLETRRQEAEEALRLETAERLQTVETLREQERMLVQQSRLAAMGEMIGNIAHQWRQPLNLLGLTVQQLLMFYDLDEFDRAYLAESVGSSMALIQHMSKTIDDFRNYFKPDKDKVEFKVKRAVAETLSLLKGSLQSPLISVEFIAKDDPIIHGYPNEFAQVLLNIVVNAKDVLTERETSDPKVTITVSSESGFAVVTVADNAGGVPAEIVDKIFDPFFTTKGPGGTGIGLFMSKTIIEKNMGGKLAVRNIAHGAEFRIEVCEGIQCAPVHPPNPGRVF